MVGNFAIGTVQCLFIGLQGARRHSGNCCMTPLPQPLYPNITISDQKLSYHVATESDKPIGQGFETSSYNIWIE